MYRIILVIVVLAVLTLIYLRIKNGQLSKKSFQKYWNLKIGSLKQLGSFNTLPATRQNLYRFTLVLFIVMAATSVLPLLLMGGHLNGISLILHVTVAPIFAVVYAAFVLFSAHNRRFESSDWPRIKAMVSKREFESKTLDKVLYWLFMGLSIPAIFSILLSMYPLFGTDGQETLLQYHRYSTLLMLLVAVAHVVSNAKVSVKSDETKKQK